MRLACTCLCMSLVLTVAKPVCAGGRTGDWPADVVTALEQAGDNRPELEKALEEVPAAQREGMQFLISQMPVIDLRALRAEFLLENVDLAYKAWREAPWHEQVPKAVFLNEILPYANINEPRDEWRRDFYERFRPVVADCRTPAEAAQRLNQRVFGELKVKYSTGRRRADQSPRESMETGLASCTGLSIVLCDACRAVGVPARVAGIPSWVNKRGNHTWVEVWDGQWHFTGAAEPSAKGLNHTWFQGDAALARRDSRMNSIYAASFKRTGTTFPLVWAPNITWVPAVNVTDRYTPEASRPDAVTRLMVRVLDSTRSKRVAARIELAGAGKQAVEARTGTSRDESFDTNDLLTFDVPHGTAWTVTAVAGGSRISQTVEVAQQSQAIIEIVLPRVISAGAAARTKDKTAGTVPSLLPPAVCYPGNGKAFADTGEHAARTAAWEAYRRSDRHKPLQADFDAKQVRFKEHLSPYTVKEVGKRPDDGWPLFIAMHGGGGVAKRFNDSQWRHMQIYYKDQAEVTGYKYLALRAPNDTWNGFYDLYVYPLVTQLVRQFILFGDVDPNKVFLMGYSHGGYGAFAIGPKIPDRFAAIHASAAAPTDGQTVAETLRNTRFTFMIGEKDTAYGRAERCLQFDKRIQELRGERKDTFPVTMEFIKGHGHGGLPDRDKISDMYPSMRNPVPRELTWRMSDPVVRDFFWLSCDDPGQNRHINATCRDNMVTVETIDVTAATVWLDSRLVDFSRPVIVSHNGVRRELTLKPDPKVLAESLNRRGDIHLSFSARIDLPLGSADAGSTGDDKADGK